MAEILISDLSTEEQIALFTNPTRTPIIKMQIEYDNGVPFKDISGIVTGGTLNIQLQSGQRRSVNFSMINNSTDFIPQDEDSDIWFDKRVKLFTGLRVDTIDYIEQQGVFLFGNPSFQSQKQSDILNVELYDKFALIDGTLNGNTIYGYEVPVGSNIGSAIRGIFTEAGESVPPMINPSLDTKTTPFSIREGFGSAYGNILTTMSEAYSQMVYYDISGIPRFEDQPKQSSASPSWEFTSGDNIMLDMTHTYNLVDVKNAVQVYGSNSSSTTLSSGYAQDDDIFSPTYVGKIGIKLAPPIDDKAIPDNTLAQLRAEYELLKMREVYEDISLTCIPINTIKEGDIVLVTNPKTGANNSRFMVTNIDFPLTFNGTMTLTLSEARMQDIVLL